MNYHSLSKYINCKLSIRKGILYMCSCTAVRYMHMPSMIDRSWCLKQHIYTGECSCLICILYSKEKVQDIKFKYQRMVPVLYGHRVCKLRSLKGAVHVTR